MHTQRKHFLGYYRKVEYEMTDHKRERQIPESHPDMKLEILSQPLRHTRPGYHQHFRAHSLAAVHLLQTLGFSSQLSAIV